MRTHYAVKPPLDATAVSACGRGKRITEKVFNVDCGLCKNTDMFILALDEAKSERERKFWEQEPLPVYNPWTGKGMECSECNGRLFRSRDRDLWTYWYQCANCQKLQGYPSETGMAQ
jgi:hypothetical protein